VSLKETDPAPTQGPDRKPNANRSSNNAAPVARALPNDLDVEAELLGDLMVMTSPDERARAMEPLRGPEDFHGAAHSAIFDAIRRLHAEGEHPGPLAVRVALAGEGEGEALRVLPSVEAGVASNARHHAETVAEKATRRRYIKAAQRIMDAAYAADGDVHQALEQLRELEQATASAHRDRLASGGTFALDGPQDERALWGREREILWAPGEPLLIVGPDGAGKTTLLQRLALARAGVDAAMLLGFPVERAERPVLYVAADRPRQAQRSFARMVGEADRELLDARLKVWKGPLPFRLESEPHALAPWVEGLGCGAVFLDSLGLLASGLATDEGGAAVAAAFSAVVANGLELVVNYHGRKANSDNKQPDKLEDVYGSRWITAASGSVISLWGAAGDPSVRFKHLKQPAEQVAPFTMTIDHDLGAVEVLEGTDFLAVLRAAKNGLTAKDGAACFEGATDKAREQKALRAFKGLEGRKLAHRKRNDDKVGAIKAPDRWYATPREGAQEPLE